MPEFRVAYLTESGTEATRIVAAKTANDAAAVVALSGQRVLRIDQAEAVSERAVDAVGDNRGERPVALGRSPRRGSSLGADFWAFRLMLTPELLRIQFAIGTVILAMAFVAIPVYHIAQSSQTATRLAPYEEKLEEIKRVRIDAATAEFMLAALEAEYATLVKDAAGTQRLQEFAARREALKARIASAYASLGVRGADGLLALESQVKSSRSYASSLQPSLTQTILMMVSVPILWIGYRIVCEWFIIIFSIYERLGELRR